jgi:hypothetical protein
MMMMTTMTEEKNRSSPCSDSRRRTLYFLHTKQTSTLSIQMHTYVATRKCPRAHTHAKIQA